MHMTSISQDLGDGKYLDSEGRIVYTIGDFTPKMGQMVYRNGRYIYGHITQTQEPMIQTGTPGIPYVQATGCKYGYIDSDLEYKELGKYSSVGLSVVQFVNDYRHAYIYTNGKYYNVNNGDSFVLPSGEYAVDMDIDDDGNCLIISGNASYHKTVTKAYTDPKGRFVGGYIASAGAMPNTISYADAQRQWGNLVKQGVIDGTRHNKIYVSYYNWYTGQTTIYWNTSEDGEDHCSYNPYVVETENSNSETNNKVKVFKNGKLINTIDLKTLIGDQSEQQALDLSAEYDYSCEGIAIGTKPSNYVKSMDIDINNMQIDSSGDIYFWGSVNIVIQMFSWIPEWVFKKADLSFDYVTYSKAQGLGTYFDSLVQKQNSTREFAIIKQYFKSQLTVSEMFYYKNGNIQIVQKSQSFNFMDLPSLYYDEDLKENTLAIACTLDLSDIIPKKVVEFDKILLHNDQDFIVSAQQDYEKFGFYDDSLYPKTPDAETKTENKIINRVQDFHYNPTNEFSGPVIIPVHGDGNDAEIQDSLSGGNPSFISDTSDFSHNNLFRYMGSNNCYYLENSNGGFIHGIYDGDTNIIISSGEQEKDDKYDIVNYRLRPYWDLDDLWTKIHNLISSITGE